ncbi:swr complex subunit [Tulasnella sp. 419]|nr:swr complex subunit [Tulasnella sp. 418]KAG8968323.1 swr complex subunit [Tulasnella sp. 419]
MASAGDIRDILSLPQNAAPRPAPAKKAAAKRESGITRELYSLIGDNAPALVAQYARPKLKQKPDLGHGKVKWELKEFTNPARNDGLKLSHWVKARPGQQEQEYPFAKYNKNPPVAYDYSMDEYNKYLEDPDWTREETDYLFAITKEYDVRFFVIADRYNFPGGKERSIQDLKARYYGICRKLIKIRPFPGDDAAKNALFSSYSYDKEREIQRKVYLNGLFARPPELIAEEEALYIECKRIEQNERRFQKERDDLLRTLAGIESGLTSLRVDDPTTTLVTATGPSSARRKRLDNGMEVDVTPGAGSANNLIALPSPYNASSALPNVERDGKSDRDRQGRQKSSSISGASVASSTRGVIAQNQVPQTIFDPQHCLTRLHPDSLPLSTKSAHKPVFLRSSQIPMAKSNVATKINQILSEVNVHPSRLVMPTMVNIERMEGVLAAAQGLLEMKKTLDRVEQEIRVLESRIRGGSEMDGDGEGEDDAGTGREGSTISTGPGAADSKRVSFVPYGLSFCGLVTQTTHFCLTAPTFCLSFLFYYLLNR